MESTADGFLMSPRIDYSSIRGKGTLVSPNEEQFELLRQMLETEPRTPEERLSSRLELEMVNGGEKGLDEEEFEASVQTLHLLATTINADAVLLRKKKEGKGFTAKFLVRKRVDMSDFMEIR
uniref:Uncharacterized protein n=1 Tax=Megaselia scalaris TaxID=36166 RepID=T1GLT1_MEGSC